MALAATVFAEQRYPGALAGVLGPQLTALAHRVPDLDGAVWAGLFAVLVYAGWSLFALRRRLKQKDVRPHERVAAV